MSDPYAAALATGATTLCRCFRLTRLDGAVFGFTDHDAPLIFDGLTFEPGAALDASETAARLGLAPDDLDASGALSSDAITEADLAAGRYDGATVEAFDVDWRTPSTRRRLGVFTMGQVERDRVAFRAELRSRAARLDVKQGRVMSTLCDVRRLGDARCKLALGPWQAAVTVLSVSGHDVTVTDTGRPRGFWDRGTVDWTSGANAGTSADLRAGFPAPGATVLSLWHLPPQSVAIGDALTITAGCDRTAATCRDRFSNLTNFRGFPHMPGENFGAEYGIPGEPGQDGGSRFA